MKVVQKISVMLSVAALLAGCAPKTSDMVVLEIGAKKVTLGEYEDFFTKNSGGWEAARKSSPQEREHFLDLLMNYKLKLQDAYDRNLLHDSDIVTELKEYRSTLASTYLLDKEVTGPGVQQLYERKREEIRSKQILIRVAPDAPPADTQKAYDKAMDLIRRAKAGENFDSLAIHNSDDPTVKSNYGDIYYFTGGQMVAGFENAAYQMKTGEMTQKPARSPFGYHVIRIVDRKPVVGSIKVSHLMARFQSMSPDSGDTARALERIKGALDSLKRGWDFHKLALKISEDAGSAQQGGDLGWFERRRFVQPFDEAAFLLTPGKISPIVRTPFGYHLILCDSLKPFPSFASMKDDLKKQYQQHRYQEDYQAFIDGLKKEFHYSFDEKTFAALVGALDSGKTTDDSAWSARVTGDIRRMTIMSLDNHSFPLDTVVMLLEKRPEFRSVQLHSAELRQKVDQIGQGFLLDAKTMSMEQSYPEFAQLMHDYTDGVVLYRAEQLEVWNKTTVSDSALKQFYAQNTSSFMFPERVNISVLAFDSDTLALLVYDSLKHGAKFGTLLERYREDGQPGATGEEARGLQPVDTDELTKLAAKIPVGEISEPLDEGNGMHAIVKVLGHEPARAKTFEEAGPEVSNQYQDHQSKLLEQAWLERIKLRYPVKQYKENLNAAFSTPPPSK
jgi:peptidyl-prolyl cis-trans isomerase SurA